MSSTKAVSKSALKRHLEVLAAGALGLIIFIVPISSFWPLIYLLASYTEFYCIAFIYIAFSISKNISTFLLLNAQEKGNRDVWSVAIVSPLKRNLEALAAGALATLIFTLPVWSFWLLIYLIFYTDFYWIALLYIGFCIIDRDVSERGGREWKFVRQWTWYKYARNYFPATLIKTAELDSKRNNMICVFPHGVIALGFLISFATTASYVEEIFPGIRMATCTLANNFKIPIFRELILSGGMCSVSKRSLNFLLGDPRGGNAAVIVPGGTAECQISRPNTHEVVLQNRKGFIKIAMQNGASLVPAYTFGETDLYDPWPNPEGSWMRWFQDKFKERFGFIPIIPYGTGFLGLVPKRLPIFTVVGKPIDVEKVLEPTDDQINELHRKFVQCLIALFEAEKHKYLQHPDEASLIIR